MICFALAAPVAPSDRLDALVTQLQRSSVLSLGPRRAHARPLSTPTMGATSDPPSAWPASLWPARSLWPAAVTLSPLPRVLVYDHDALCTRVRYVLGVKNVKHRLSWLLDDDVVTPTALVGSKVVPIFQPEGTGGPSLTGSMDICVSIDTDAKYGPPGYFRPASGRTDIADWFTRNETDILRLVVPRVLRAQLPELASRDARREFVQQHALKDPGDYAANYAMTPTILERLQPLMYELDTLIFSKEGCTEGGISFDDVDLFPRLRELTLVKDLVMPDKMKDYVEYHSSVSDVAVYNIFAT